MTDDKANGYVGAIEKYEEKGSTLLHLKQNNYIDQKIR